MAKWRQDFHSIEKYQFIHNFIPHKHHGTRAKLLSPKALITYTLLLTLTLGIFKLIPLILPGVLGYASNINIKELHDFANQQRVQEGRSELMLNLALSKAAQKKAEDMFKKDYWEHIAPDGTEPWDFILGQGYDYAFAGENLAKNFHYSKEVVRAWYDSPSHRENLVSNNYNEVGYAVVDGILGGYETTLVVQMFGKSRRPAYLSALHDSEEQILAQLEAVTPKPATTRATTPEIKPTNVLPAIDVSVATKSINIVFGGFLISLLAVDIWYSRKHGITKVTGHTLAHLTFLLLVFAGIWIALVPGKIL